MAMAARRPAPPPPTSTTSWEAVTARPWGRRSEASGQRLSASDRLHMVFGVTLVRQDLAVVANHAAGNAAVVVLVTDNPTAAIVEPFIADQAVVVLVLEVFTVHDVPARGACAGESSSDLRHRHPPSQTTGRPERPVGEDQSGDHVRRSKSAGEGPRPPNRPLPWHPRPGWVKCIPGGVSAGRPDLRAVLRRWAYPHHAPYCPTPGGLARGRARNLWRGCWPPAPRGGAGVGERVD